MTGKQEVWDDVWKSYEIDIRDYSGRLRRILKRARMECVKDYVDSKETGAVRIAECGCGSGKLTLSVAKAFGTETHLFDISKEAVKTAMGELQGTLRRIQNLPRQPHGHPLRRQRIRHNDELRSERAF